MATETAFELSHDYVGTEHLLVGLLKVDGVAKTVLNENGIDSERILELVNKLISSGNPTGTYEYDTMTPRAKRILDNAYVESAKYNSDLVGTEHILLALIKENESIAVRLLSTLGVSMQKLYVDILTAMGMEVAAAKNDYAGSKGSDSWGHLSCRHLPC